jgi:hypothetical protein
MAASTAPRRSEIEPNYWFGITGSALLIRHH